MTWLKKKGSSQLPRQEILILESVFSQLSPDDLSGEQVWKPCVHLLLLPYGVVFGSQVPNLVYIAEAAVPHG